MVTVAELSRDLRFRMYVQEVLISDLSIPCYAIVRSGCNWMSLVSLYKVDNNGARYIDDVCPTQPGVVGRLSFLEVPGVDLMLFEALVCYRSTVYYNIFSYTDDVISLKTSCSIEYDSDGNFRRLKPCTSKTCFADIDLDGIPELILTGIIEHLDERYEATRSGTWRRVYKWSPHAMAFVESPGLRSGIETEPHPWNGH